MGARAEGMGEAFSALADDLSAIWWNPAGLVQMDKNQIEWEGGDRESGIPYTGFFAANYMLQNRMNFALSYSRPYHDVGAIPNVNAGEFVGGWTKLPQGGFGPGDVPGTLAIPGSGSVRFTDITDTTVQAFLKTCTGSTLIRPSKRTCWPSPMPRRFPRTTICPWAST